MWVAVAVAALGLALTGFLHQSLAERESRLLESALGASADQAATEVEHLVGTHLVNLGYFARGAFRTPFVWRGRAETFLEYYPSAVYLESVDLELGTHWSVPQRSKGIELSAVEVRELVEEHARPGAGGLFASTTTLSDGSMGLVALGPEMQGDHIRGWTFLLYDAEQVVMSFLTAQVASDLLLGLRVGGRDFGEELRQGESLEAPIERRELDIPGPVVWTLSISPRSPGVRSEVSLLLLAVLLGGTALSLLAGIAVALWLLANARSRQVSQLNEGLETRVQARTQELAARNEELDRFASFLSHELKQPVGALTLWGDLLASELDSFSDKQGKRVLGIQKAAQRMNELINGQLALAKIGSAPKRDRVDLNSLVKEVLRDLQPELDRAEAQVDLSDLPLVIGDRLLLRDLFRNLVENSLKYRRQDVAPRIGISSQLDNGRAQIVLRDNGIGFSAAQSDKIFRVMTQLDPRAQGVGLGLAICRRIAEVHGGDLVAEGETNNGATFTLTLPTH